MQKREGRQKGGGPAVCDLLPLDFFLLLASSFLNSFPLWSGSLPRCRVSLMASSNKIVAAVAPDYIKCSLLSFHVNNNSSNNNNAATAA